MQLNYRTLFFILIFHPILCFPQQDKQTTNSGNLRVFTLENKHLSLKVVVDNGVLKADSLLGKIEFPGIGGSVPIGLVTDAGYRLEIVWTDWQAPGKKNNGDNPVLLSQEDFTLTNSNYLNTSKDELALTFTSASLPLQLVITYQLKADKFYSKRKIAIRDTFQGNHFLHAISARKGKVQLFDNLDKPVLPEITVLNPGGFGQPVAVCTKNPVTTKKAGAFLGLEYPASQNLMQTSIGQLEINLSQEFGEKISKEFIESEWVAEALLPHPYVQSAFYDYVKDIRVAPAGPYTLYNSWYDLRSPEYPGVKPANIMNEENIFNIIDLFKKNMIDKHDIPLDALVLDDGWDIYESDWLMRQETFPNGLKPISDKLKTMGTALGMWFGPTGGYSFRMKRINWMKQHGYEVVGEGRDHAMLCLGGKNYSKLFEKRTCELVKEGVSYFKWDGIQFSCSETDHGHAVGLYSRRAILESVIAKCRAVRKINPSVYLNITSGTWLSPWWVKYANQIWMDGGDYGFADVPSVHTRDAAITYRDLVLYDDFINKGLWFPTANLMTHGIIKGNLENVGGENDPIDKFSNDVVLYFARGISMFELYISPDLLSDAEWDVLVKAIQWAKANKELLAKTFMVGGNPGKGECYAYIHAKGDKGIIAARNPVIEPSSMKIKLDPAYGFNPDQGDWVVEKVYPHHYILPKFYGAGDEIEIPLQGFETAVYEIYPASGNKRPLPAGVRFDMTYKGGMDYQLNIYEPNPNARFLEISKDETLIKSMVWKGKLLNRIKDLPMPRSAPPARLVSGSDNISRNLSGEITVSFTENLTEGLVSYLIKPDADSQLSDLPEMTGLVDGKEVTLQIEKQKGKWYWISIPLSAGEHTVQLKSKNSDTSPPWAGTASLWARVKYQENPLQITLNASLPREGVRILPPLPYLPGIFPKNLKLAEGSIHFGK